MLENAQAGGELLKTLGFALKQPEGAFRFSQDALLLAEFAVRVCKETELCVDLGTGCGVVALTLLKHWPQAHCLGVEREAELVEAARQNAGQWALEQRFTCLHGDVEDLPACYHGRAALVLANPPWRRTEAGRHSPSPLRQRALFAEEYTFEKFMRAAARVLAPRGHLALVCGVGRLEEVLEKARKHGLNPEILQFVHARKDRNASVFLLKARKDVKGELKVLPPLTQLDSGTDLENT